MNAKHTTAPTSFFSRNYFISCLVLVVIGLTLVAIFAPSRPKAEHVTITSDQWVCVDSRPALLHAECTQYVRRVSK
jgi:hypothetical protein